MEPTEGFVDKGNYLIMLYAIGLNPEVSWISQEANKGPWWKDDTAYFCHLEKSLAEQNSSLRCACVTTVNTDIYVVRFLLNEHMQELEGAGNDTGLH